MRGYEGFYEVSDLGRVRSLDRLVADRWGGLRPEHGRIMSQCLVERGRTYWGVNLARDGRKKLHKVHRLVGEAFLGPQPLGMHTLHGPSGKLDNRLANLAYGPPAQNIADQERDGTRRRGTGKPEARLTEAIVMRCREWYAAGGISLNALAAEFGVSGQTMGKAVTGQTWRHVMACGEAVATAG